MKTQYFNRCLLGTSVVVVGAMWAVPASGDVLSLNQAYTLATSGNVGSFVQPDPADDLGTLLTDGVIRGNATGDTTGQIWLERRFASELTMTLTIGMDLGEMANLTGFNIHTVPRYYGVTWPHVVDVDVSADGVDFVDFAEWANPVHVSGEPNSANYVWQNSADLDPGLVPLDARYVRIALTLSAGTVVNENRWLGIDELQVIGTVPEPSSMALLGGVGFWGFRRRRGA